MNSSLTFSAPLRVKILTLKSNAQAGDGSFTGYRRHQLGSSADYPASELSPSSDGVTDQSVPRTPGSQKRPAFLEIPDGMRLILLP